MTVKYIFYIIIMTVMFPTSGDDPFPVIEFINLCIKHIFYLFILFIISNLSLFLFRAVDQSPPDW
jgi:hypothetical protein